MQFRSTTLPATRLRSLAWDGDDLVDWVGGGRYHPDGTQERLNVGRGERVISFTGQETGEPANAFTIFDLRTRRLERAADLAESPGTRVMAIDDDHVVCFDGHPRILQLSTGQIVHRWDDLEGGRGILQPSVSMPPPAPPWLACDPANRRFALGWPNRIEVVAIDGGA